MTSSIRTVLVVGEEPTQLVEILKNARCRVQTARRSELASILASGSSPDLIVTELALDESEQKFHAMADTAPVMIVTSDANRYATYFNQAWLDFTGRDMSQELGMGWLAHVHPEDRESCIAGMASSFATQTECRIEYRLLRHDGEYRNLLCKGVPQYSPHGSFTGYIASLVDITELKQHQLELEDHRQRLHELTGNLLVAQENASRELARELHDVSSQELVVVGHKIAALEAYVKNDPCLAEKLAQIAEKVAELAKDLHRTSRELHPSTAEDLGLPPALAEECEAFEERSGIPTSLSAVNVPPELSKEVTLCLYRIAQESLRNIGKHAAEAGSVEIRLEGAAEELTLRITDTGNGFDAAEVRKKGGLGLISMEERARLLGGGCLVRSKPGRGTTIIVTVPTMQKSSKNVKKKASGKG